MGGTSQTNAMRAEILLLMDLIINTLKDEMRKDIQEGFLVLKYKAKR